MSASGPPSRRADAGSARAGRARWRIAGILLILAALAGGGVLGTVSGRHVPRALLQPTALAAETAPAGSASSTWYCPGSPGEDAGTTHLVLTSASDAPVRASVAVVGESGLPRVTVLQLAPHAEAQLVPAQLLHTPWLASRVEVTGGAVSASEVVDGRTGRTVVSCASEVSPRWYFASGSTRGGSTLTVTVFNPTQSLAVVDLSFLTSSGATAPAPFQGLVVGPGALRTFTVGRYVQNQAAVATDVTTRAGAVVAGELQLYGPGGKGGVALSLGAPATSRTWDLPGIEDLPGGVSAIAVFNPTDRGEHVAVDVRLPTGPVAPFEQVLGPEAVWTLPTSQQLRIATGEPYNLEVQATGAGVVVARSGAGGRKRPASWWAQDVGVSSAQWGVARRWLVPSLSAVALAAPFSTRGVPVRAASSVLALENPTAHPLRIEIGSWGPSGRSAHRVIVLHLAALGVARVAAPSGPAVVQADGPLAVVGDASPAGTAGVVEVPAVPLR